MKRFCVYAGCLMACVVFLSLLNDWIVIRLIRKSNSLMMCKMERFWQICEKDDFPILGSSRAQSNFVPSLISNRCYNYGCDGMHLPEVVFLLKGLKGRESSLPIIVNLDPWEFYGFDNPEFVGDYRLAPKSGRMLFLDRIPGVRFYGETRKAFVAYVNERKSVTKKIDNGAVLLKTSRTPNEWAVINRKLAQQKFVPDVHAAKIFENALVDLAPRKVYVVVSPCNSRFMELYENMDDLCRYLTHLAMLPNVTVVNLFGNAKFTDADFADPTHLNCDGAQKFTEILKTFIKE